MAQALTGYEINRPNNGNKVFNFVCGYMMFYRCVAPPSFLANLQPEPLLYLTCAHLAIKARFPTPSIWSIFPSFRILPASCNASGHCYNS